MFSLRDFILHTCTYHLYSFYLTTYKIMMNFGGLNWFDSLTKKLKIILDKIDNVIYTFVFYYSKVLFPFSVCIKLYQHQQPIIKLLSHSLIYILWWVTKYRFWCEITILSYYPDLLSFFLHILYSQGGPINVVYSYDGQILFL